MGVKIKVYFQGLHMTYVIFVLVIILNYLFWIFSLTLQVKYKYILTTNWFYIIYILYMKSNHGVGKKIKNNYGWKLKLPWALILGDKTSWIHCFFPYIQISSPNFGETNVQNLEFVLQTS
jgi:hypothetical protein